MHWRETERAMTVTNHPTRPFPKFDPFQENRQLPNVGYRHPSARNRTVR
jgi:hypothetical protein